MSFQMLSNEAVLYLHDEVLNPGELEGLALDKSLDAALSRVWHRINYGLIEDVYDLAAAYAVVIATGHCFNDANKRTAFATMDMCLLLNGVEVEWNKEEIGDIIIMTAQGQLDETELAVWLRSRFKD